LEKIEMKKTLVAVAAMAAVTGAMANATIYGTLEQTYNKSTDTVNGSVISTKTGIGEYQTGGSLIGFKGSEDLNGGIKASYLYEMGVNLQTSASTYTNRQAFVGLNGGFGSVRLGKQYSAGFLNAVAADPGGATGAAGALYLAPMTGYNGSEAPLRQDQAVQFDLPSFVPGLGITLTKVWGGANSAPTNGYSTTETNGVKTGDGTGWAIKYNSGPVYVGVTSDTVTNVGINFGTQDNSVAQSTVAALAATAANLTAASSTTKNKLSTATATYDLGMAKVGYNQTKMAVGAEFLKASMTSVSVPFGATNVFYSASTGSGNATSGTYAITLKNYSLKGSQYGVNHAMSKRTVAYIHAGRTTLDAPSATTVILRKINSYGIGIHHSF
jgi:predicted porin